MRHSTRMYSIACAFALCWAVQGRAADEDEIDTSTRDLFETGGLADETTDDFEREEWSFSYRNHRRSLFWPWEESDATDIDWGVDLRYNTGSFEGADFEAQRFAAMLGKRFSPALYAEVWVGNHRLETQAAADDLTNYEATVRVTPGETLDLRLQTSRDFLYRDGFVSAAIDELLAARTHSLALTWLALPRLRVAADTSWRSLSDGNTGRHHALSLLYGISPSWPWIWIGIGAQWLGYDEQRQSYWSPDQFTSVGLRLQASFPLGRSFEANLAANLDRIDESDVGEGDGEYVDGGFTYHLTPTLRVRLSARRINSIQRGERWSETTYLLSLAGPLF